MQVSYPFSSSPVLTDQQWSKLSQFWVNTGVVKRTLNELEVYADSSGMRVKVRPGQAWVKGHFFESDAEETMSIAAANSTNPRIDYIIARCDWALGNIRLAVLQGEPSVSPEAPALTQNTARWEMPLARVTVPANAVTINQAYINDWRNYTIDRDLDWHNVSFINGFYDKNLQYYHAAAYMKQDGMVTLKGLVATGVFGNENAMFNIPWQYRSNRIVTKAVLAFHDVYGYGMAVVEVQPSGNVVTKATKFTGQPETQSPTWISLDGFTFLTEV